MQATPRPFRLLQRRVGAVLAALPAAGAGEVRGVHRARVATRRLRAWLPALEGMTDARALKRLRRRVRGLTRVLGPVRELDVALGHLDQIGRESGTPDRVLGRVRGHLRARRREARRHLLKALKADPGAAIEEMASSLPSTEVDATAALAMATDRGRRRAARRALDLAAAIRAAGGLYVPDRLHAVRVATKQLRYAIEVDRDLSGSRAGRRLGRLKSVQDLLGLVHDFDVLAEHVRAVQGAVVADQPLVARQLEEPLRVIDAHCRTGHARFLRGRAELLDLCRTVRAAARAGRPTFAE